MTEPSQSAYRHIFKATTLFGGVQAYNILISLVRAKFVALFLGPAGMGILNLLQMPLGLIGQLTGLGISYSAVRDISQASAAGDEVKISRTLSIFRRWIWWTGLAGVIVTMALSPFLSQWTFGNRDYTYAFLILSSTLLFTALANGYSSALQGLRRLRHMARAAVIGSTVGLIVSIPLYYYYRIDGIVPTIILGAVTSLVLNWFYYRKSKIPAARLSLREIWSEGNAMVRFGILITISQLITTFVNYLVNIYIGRTGGVDQVGLYQAGFSITDKYVGLIFAAMATDYYPRLSGIVDDRRKLAETVNQQAEIALLILGPILVLLLTTLPLVIRILYTPKFLPIIGFIPWIILGMPFKAASWALGMIILAKGDSKLFLVSEIAANLILITFNILGYKNLGLKGLGLSFFAMYVLYFLIILFITRRYYHFSYTLSFYKVFLGMTAICVIAVAFAIWLGFPYAYLSGAGLLLVSGLISYTELNRRLSLGSYLRSLIDKRAGKGQ